MSQFGGVERTGPWETAGDHERRIRALEATPDCCGDCPDAPGLGLYSDWVLALECDTLAYWPLQEAGGDAIDQGPLGADCQPIGTPEYQVTGPSSNDLAYAVRLDSPPDTSITGDSFDNIADELGLGSYAGDFSTLCWIKPDSTADSSWQIPIIGTWDVFRHGWVLYLTQTTRQLTFNTGNGTSVDVLVGPEIPMDEWTLVGATREADGGTVRLYVNGVEVDDDTGLNNFSPNGHGIRLGAVDRDFAGSDAYTFQGDMAGAVYVGCLLTAAEMLDAYEQASTPVAGFVLTTDGEGNCEWSPPCCDEECTSFPDAITELAQTRGLLAYYRLGDSSGDWLDTSGVGTAVDLELEAGGVPLTRHVTGALEDDDDGAVQFNDPTWDDSEGLFANIAGTKLSNLGSGNLTCIAWVKSSGPQTTFSGVMGSMNTFPTVGGWGISIDSDELPFFRRESATGAGVARLLGPELIVGEWTFLVGTYDTVEGHKFYVNGSLVATDTATFSTSNSNLFRIGLLNTLGVSTDVRSFYGVIDEVSVWDDALTLSEIQVLYAASQCAVTGACAGVIDSTENVLDECGVHSSNGTTPETEEFVLTADGAGGSLWAYPTLEALADGS